MKKYIFLSILLKSNEALNKMIYGIASNDNVHTICAHGVVSECFHFKIF